jgi:hypothetical protein
MPDFLNGERRYSLTYTMGSRTTMTELALKTDSLGRTEAVAKTVVAMTGTAIVTLGPSYPSQDESTKSDEDLTWACSKLY